MIASQLPLEICKLQSALQFLHYEMNDMLITAGFPAVGLLQPIRVIKVRRVLYRGAKYEIFCLTIALRELRK